MDLSTLMGVDVDVTVDVGSGTVPLAQLMNMPADGELELAACENVLRVNGEPYAIVELFDVDGYYQARVLMILGETNETMEPGPATADTDLRAKLARALRAS